MACRFFFISSDVRESSASCRFSALICEALGPGGDDPMLVSYGSDGWSVNQVVVQLPGCDDAPGFNAQ